MNLWNCTHHETDHGAGCTVRQPDMSTGKTEAHTNKHDPSDANGADESTVPEGLNPQAKCESTPGADEIFRCFPKEDRETTTGDPGDKG